MKPATFILWLLIAILSASAPAFAIDALVQPSLSGTKTDNADCLKCHNGSKEIKVAGGEEGLRGLHAIKKLAYSKSVHAGMACVACHTGIKDGSQPHVGKIARTEGCVACHTELWARAKQDKQTKDKPRLGVVVANIEAYKSTTHAKQNADDPTRVNASCDDCHDTHTFNVPPQGSPDRTSWHLTIPNTCGEKCHTDQLEEYASSIHGKRSSMNTIPMRLSVSTVIPHTASPALRENLSSWISCKLAVVAIKTI